MQFCSNCGSQIIPETNKFCGECGTKVDPIPQTPDVEKSFLGVDKICLKTGDVFKIVSCDTNETKVIIEASERVKSNLLIDTLNGVLTISQKTSTVPFFGTQVVIGNHSKSISIVGTSIDSISRNSVVINGQTVCGEIPIKVFISTPIGTNLDFDSKGDVEVAVNDIKSFISIKSSGECNLVAGEITGLYAHSSDDLTLEVSSITSDGFDLKSSGDLNAKIHSFNGEKCILDSSSDCIFVTGTGKFGELSLKSSGDMNASFASLDGEKFTVSSSSDCDLTLDRVRLEELSLKASGDLDGNITSIEVNNLNITASSDSKLMIKEAKIDSCLSIKSSGDCDLSVTSGTINSLVANIYSDADFTIKAQTIDSNIRVSGDLIGELRTNTITKRVSGDDDLEVLH